MKRDYDSGVKSDIHFFTGVEIENTQFKGMKTLFWVCKPSDTIYSVLDKIPLNFHHVYVGANHSLKESSDFFRDRVYFICKQLITSGYAVTLDVDVELYTEVYEEFTDYIGNPLLLIQLSVVLPNIERYKNITVKIDDADFNYSNSKVWCLTLDDIKQEKHSTDWSEYSSDEVIE